MKTMQLVGRCRSRRAKIKGHYWCVKPFGHNGKHVGWLDKKLNWKMTWRRGR